MNARFRVISGERASLQRLRRPETLTALEIRGPCVRSLAGIERALNLGVLRLIDVRDLDLSPAVGLERLHELEVDSPRGAFSWAAIAQCRRLDTLSIHVVESDHESALAALELSSLRRLRFVSLSCSKPGAVELDVHWAAELPALQELDLGGCMLADDQLEVIARAPALEQVAFVPRLGQVDRLRALAGDRLEIIDVLDELANTGLNKLQDESDKTGEPRYSIGLDLAEHWDLETNPDAERRLKARLREHDRALLSRIEFATEAAAVWISAGSWKDLDSVLTLIN